MKRIIILGPPGSGKGTICKIFADRFNVKHISTGDIFRNQISNKTPLGLKVQKYVTSGGYVPDEVTNNIVLIGLNPVLKANQQFILDGFPRTIPQADFLKSHNIEIELAILLKVDHEVIMQRLTGRRVCPTCKTSYHINFKPPQVKGFCDQDKTKLIQRKDDTPTKIKKRLEIYENQTKTLIDYYKKIIFEVNSGGDLETMVKRIKGKII